MKMKIRVKTLLLGMIVLAVGYLWVIPQSTLAIAKYLDGKDSPRAGLFYERHIKMDDSIQGRLDYAQSLVKYFGKFTIYQQGWGGGEETTREDLIRAEELLQEILQMEPSPREEKLYMDAYRMRMDIAIAKGDVDGLRQLIYLGENHKEIMMDEASLYKAYLYFTNREFEEAKIIVDRLQQEGLDDPRQEILLAEIHLANGDAKGARDLYKKLQRRDWRSLKDTYFASPTFGHRNFWLDESRSLLEGNNRIKGRVTFEGEPMAFVEIYILSADGGVRIGGESFVAITDEKGYFETLPLSDGIYDVGLGLDGSLLTDKVFQKSETGYVQVPGDDFIEYTFRDTFQVYSPQPGSVVEDDLFTVSWEEVPEADYYTVEPVIFSNPLERSGGSFRSPIEDIGGEGRFRGTSADFRISDFRNQTGGMTFEGEEWLLGSGAVLGKFLPGGEYPIIVNAYDKNNQLITSSFPMRTYYDKIPSIVVEGELSPGQRLVAQMKYPEAIEYYEEVLLEEPDHIEAISSLVKIYGIGWKKGEKNLDRAFELLERVDDERLASNLINSIIFEFEADEILGSEEKIMDMIAILEKYNEDDAHYARFKYHRAKGNYREARDSLENLENFLPDTLVFLHIYFGDYDLAVERLLDDRFYPSRLQGETFRSAILGLGENPPSADEMEALREFLLEMINGGAYERKVGIYNRLVNNVDNQDILTIADEIYNERHWNY